MRVCLYNESGVEDFSVLACVCECMASVRLCGSLNGCALFSFVRASLTKMGVLEVPLDVACSLAALAGALLIAQQGSCS